MNNIFVRMAVGATIGLVVGLSINAYKNMQDKKEQSKKSQ